MTEAALLVSIIGLISSNAALVWLLARRASAPPSPMAEAVRAAFAPPVRAPVPAALAAEYARQRKPNGGAKPPSPPLRPETFAAVDGDPLRDG